jgi:hypothetical protein
MMRKIHPRRKLEELKRLIEETLSAIGISVEDWVRDVGGLGARDNPWVYEGMIHNDSS